MESIPEDVALTDKIVAKCKSFFITYLLPELISHRLKCGVLCQHPELTVFVGRLKKA